MAYFPKTGKRKALRKGAKKGKVTKAKIYKRGKKASATSVIALNRKVNRLIRGVEVKETRNEGTTNLVGTGNVNFDGQVFCINPTTTTADPKGIVVGLGDLEGQRVGNQISTKSNVFKFVAIIKPWNATTNPNPRPMYFKVWVISIRGGNYGTTHSDVSNLIKTRFFDTGNSYQGWSDTIMDTIKPVNEDVFNVHYVKTFKLGPATTMASGAGGATPTSAQGYSNNDFRLSIKWSVPLTKYTAKTIRYNDTDGSSFNPTKWLFFTCHNADGSTIGTQVPIELYYNHHYRFTDM